jgi:ATP-dependent DNA ligase
MAWNERRVYLENIYHEIKIPNTYLSDIVGNNKKGFYDWLCSNNGKGVILKNKDAGYSSGPTRDFLEVDNLRGGKENITLQNKDYRELLKIEDIKDHFDFDYYLSLRALDQMEL